MPTYPEMAGFVHAIGLPIHDGDGLALVNVWSDAYDVVHPAPLPYDDDPVDGAGLRRFVLNSLPPATVPAVRTFGAHSLIEEMEHYANIGADAVRAFVANPGSDPLAALTIYRAVQSGKVKVAEWEGRRIRDVRTDDNTLGHVYPRPEAGWAGRVGGTIHEVGAEGEARGWVQGRVEAMGWVVVAGAKGRK